MRWRHFKNAWLISLLIVCAGIVVLPLGAILGYLLVQGAGAINWDFFVQAQKPVGELGGGMGHSILGTLQLVGLACGLGIPLGLGCGVYLSEYGKREKMAYFVRFALDLLSSTPSILIGVFVYIVVVVPTKKFSLASGALALSIILLPLVARTSEELLKLIPNDLREAGLALGIPRWRVTLQIVLRSALPAIRAAILLAVARIAGETAPLVFTAFGSPNFTGFGWGALGEPSSALPLQIYTYAVSPFDEWHRMAWAGALVLVLAVLVINATIRVWGGSNDSGSSD